MEIKRKTTILIIACLLMSLPAVQAKWRPIKPGDHVFDANVLPTACVKRQS